MNRVKAIKDREGLCWNCLKTKEHIHKIVIDEMGYGSYFDMFSTELHLCDECYNKHPEYWQLNTHEVWNGSMAYDFEDEIFDFVDKMPLEGKQFFYNEFDKGMDARPMDPQDWLDYQLDLLPYEKCLEYGLYAPEEVKSYKERFPTCQYPVNRVYKDGSVGCWCPFGAVGDKGQKVGLNISTECYKCEKYKKRETPLMNVLNEDWNEYAIKVIAGTLK